MRETRHRLNQTPTVNRRRIKVPPIPRLVRPGQWSKLIALTFAISGIVISIQALSAYHINTKVIYFAQASKSLTPGSRLLLGDFTVVKYLVPNASLVSQAPPPSTVLGGILAVPIPKGGIITSSDLAQKQHGNLFRQISFAIPLSHAVAGTLQAGDRIDILSTTGSGSSAMTTVVARAVEVTSINYTAQSIGTVSDPPVTITVAAPDSMTTLGIANAASSGTIWIDLANGANAPDDSGTYQVGFGG